MSLGCIYGIGWMFCAWLCVCVHLYICSVCGFTRLMSLLISYRVRLYTPLNINEGGTLAHALSICFCQFSVVSVHKFIAVGIVIYYSNCDDSSNVWKLLCIQYELGMTVNHAKLWFCFFFSSLLLLIRFISLTWMVCFSSINPYPTVTSKLSYGELC